MVRDFSVLTVSICFIQIALLHTGLREDKDAQIAGLIFLSQRTNGEFEE